MPNFSKSPNSDIRAVFVLLEARGVRQRWLGAQLGIREDEVSRLKAGVPRPGDMDEDAFVARAAGCLRLTVPELRALASHEASVALTA